MSRGQVPITPRDRTVARRLGIEDAQLVADVVSVLGRSLDTGDVARARRLWGTDATGAFLRILRDAYPPPPEGLGLTQKTTHTSATTGAAHMKGRETKCRH